MSPAESLNILLIEDNPADADLLQEIAEDVARSIWSITQAERLVDALIQLKTQVFDVVLLDLSLPDAQGLSIIAEIQQVAPLTPIVVLTGWSDEKIGLEALRCGVQDFLVKGQIEPSLLVRTVNYAIERTRAQQMIQQQSAAIAASRDGIAILNDQWEYIYVNQAYLTLYGYTTADALLGQSWQHAYSRSERQRIGQQLLPALEHTGHWIGEAIGQTRANHPFHQELSVTVLQDGGYVCTVRDITARRQTQVVLEKSEQKFRTLVANIPGVIYRCLPEEPWTVMFVSDGIEALSGYPASTFLRQKFHHLRQLCHPEDQQQAQMMVMDALASHQSFVLEYRLVAQDGTIRWVYEKGQGVWNQNGTLLYLDGVMFDISDRKAAEAQLQQSRRQLSAHNQVLIELSTSQIINQSNFEMACQEINEVISRALEVEQVGIWLFNPEKTQLHCVDFYRRSCDQHLQSADLIVAQYPIYFQAWQNARVMITHDVEVDPHVSELLDSYLHPLGIRSLLTGVIRLNGDLVGIICLEHVGPPRHWSPEEQTFAGAIADFVSLALQASNRRQAEEALRKSEARFQAILDNAETMIYLKDLAGQYVLINHQFQRHCRLPQQQVIGQTDRELYPSEIAEPLWENDQQVISTKTSIAFEEVLAHPDGIRTYLSVKFPLLDHEGQLYAIGGISTDITNRKAAEIEILRSLEQAKELSDLKSRFITTASHEFRTPLTTILGSSEMLEHSGHKWPLEKQHHYFNQIQTAVHHMIQLMDDLLILSQAEAGKLPFRPTEVNLCTLCQSVLDTIQSGLSEPRTIDLHCQMVQPISHLDEHLMRQILQNLLSNAIKYSKPPTAVEVTLTEELQTIRIQVEDHGMGIPLADQVRIFESFYRANNVGTIAGTGFGLTIVKRAVDLHQGEIIVNSQLGRGTIFIVRIPRYPIESIH